VKVEEKHMSDGDDKQRRGVTSELTINTRDTITNRWKMMRTIVWILRSWYAHSKHGQSPGHHRRVRCQQFATRGWTTPPQPLQKNENEQLDGAKPIF